MASQPEKPTTLDIVIAGAIKDFRSMIGVRIRVKEPEMHRYARVNARTVQRNLRERFPGSDEQPAFHLSPNDGLVVYAHEGERHIIPLTDLGYSYHADNDQYLPISTVSVEPNGQLRLFD